MIFALEQLAKLRSELDIVQGNMRVFNDMLNELPNTINNDEDWELLADLQRTCHTMQKRIVELVEKVANEEVTNELLRVNDELNNLFLRYERLAKKRNPTNSPQQPLPPSNIQQTKTDDTTLIDFSDDTGASNVSERLASLHLTGIKASTVGSANLGAAAAVSGDADFDTFAQHRSASDKQKVNGSSYHDNVNPDQVNLSLASLTQAKTDRENLSSTNKDVCRHD